MLITLASNSPRRRKLLSLSGWTFDVAPVDVDETPFAVEDPRAYVMRLAQTKAKASASQPDSADLILAADTTVADGGDILGKPIDSEEAKGMLHRLRGRTHQVHSAIAVFQKSDRTLHTDLCTTDVPMRDYTGSEIDAYIATGDPMDKAGAYAIQHRGFDPVIGMQGCYASVMGLPLCHLVRTLRKIGVHAPRDVPQACQVFLDYRCPVYPQILRGDR